MSLVRLGRSFSRLSRRFLPDPFVFALALTLISFAIAVLYQWWQAPRWHSLSELLIFWQKNALWQYLEFAMQMVLVLLTGYAVAVAPPIHRFIRALARWPANGTSAVIMTAALSILAGVIHWGLALIVGATFAHEVGVRFASEKRPLHYPLCGAAAYLGLMVWHGGLSGSAPLVMNTPGHFLSEQVARIPVVETLLSPMNLTLLFVFIVGLPLLAGVLHPRESAEIEPCPIPPTTVPQRREKSAARGVELWEERPWLIVPLVAIAALSLLAAGLSRFQLSLNSLNFIFLFLGLALHRTPRAYWQAVRDGVHSVSGIILLFPFYAGIYGLLAYDDMIRQGLQAVLAHASQDLFVLGSFFSAGLVNLFVPSGGGQWGIQGPLAIAGAEQLGIPLGKITMAVAYGDEWTNMLQPFWALPILQITGLKARDIVGYTGLVMLIALPVYLLVLLCF